MKPKFSVGDCVMFLGCSGYGKLLGTVTEIISRNDGIGYRISVSGSAYFLAHVQRAESVVYPSISSRLMSKSKTK